jgi:hypothetical protein
VQYLQAVIDAKVITKYKHHDSGPGCVRERRFQDFECKWMEMDSRLHDGTEALSQFSSGSYSSYDMPCHAIGGVLKSLQEG